MLGYNENSKFLLGHTFNLLLRRVRACKKRWKRRKKVGCSWQSIGLQSDI